ncbi:hypothetical protein HanRHA438_Chr06g0249251 [Helianthus annuus]|nr:hypothetical protein HanRHA438_Chr06g0249251 [Helianthus annuus]
MKFLFGFCVKEPKVLIIGFESSIFYWFYAVELVKMELGLIRVRVSGNVW